MEMFSPARPFGRGGPTVAALALVSLAGCAVPGPTGPVAGQPVVSFDWSTGSAPSPGLRRWSLDALGRWHERHADGTPDEVFDVVERGSALGCPGSIATHGDTPNFHLFVPDFGCSRMAVLFTRGEQPWMLLGQMRDIR